MYPVWAYPLGLIGLATLPALLAVYLLRHRHRRLPVSALFLWNFAQPPRRGGARLKRSPLPPIFWLETILLALLALAAADPLFPRADARRELLVVLDAGVAMQAPGPNGAPALEQALRQVRREFRSEPWRRRRVIEAADTPTVRVDATETGSALAQLDGFSARAPRSDLAAALTLAMRLAGSADAILVVTDRPPAAPPEDPRLRWIALGAASANVAITDALRGPDNAGGEVCVTEIANFSGEQKTLTLFMEQGIRSEQAARFVLDAGARQRVRLNVPDARAPLTLRLEPDDDFMVDNQVVLCPEPLPRLPVSLRMQPESLHATLLRKALTAGGRVAGAPTDGASSPPTPALIFRDAAEPESVYPPWTVVLHSPPEPQPFAGPFLRTTRHPLIEELALDGVLWGAQSSYPLPGVPVLCLADGTPLIAIADGPVLHLQWAPEQSTLQRTPDWPILIDNLLAWRTESLPAGQPRNMPLGARAVWESPDSGFATVRHPDGSVARLPSREGMTIFKPDQPGLYRIEPPRGEAFETGVNLLAPATSDLRARGAGEWGTRLSPEGRVATRVSSAGFLLLAALALFAGHGWLIVKGRGL